MASKPIPDGHRGITAYLGIRDAAKAIDFYKTVFGAKEMFRLETPDGKIGHAELNFGDCSLMLAEPCDQAALGCSQAQEKPAIGLHLYVEDVDAQFERALQAGASTVMPVQNQFYGDRSGTLRDPFGNLWFIATHIEDLSPEEIRARAAKMFHANNP